MAGSALEKIKDAWVKEKVSRGLAELPEDFYKEAARHVAELKRGLAITGDLQRELLEGELGNVLRMVQEIHTTRVLKAMDEVFREKLPSSALERERHAFGEVREVLRGLHRDLVAPAVEGKVAIAAPPEISNLALIFLADVPQIVGDDLRAYGPFRGGEVAFIPKRIAELLVKRNCARQLELKP